MPDHRFHITDTAPLHEQWFTKTERDMIASGLFPSVADLKKKMQDRIDGHTPIRVGASPSCTNDVYSRLG